MNADSTMQDSKGKITRIRVHLSQSLYMAKFSSLPQPVEFDIEDYDPEIWMRDVLEDGFFMFTDEAGVFTMIPTNRILRVVVLKETKNGKEYQDS